MEQSFSVTVDGTTVGKVTVQRQGLYYRFFCRCSLSGDGIYRLAVTCGEHRDNLGVLVPKEDSFVLETKISVKRIGEGDMSFFLLSNTESHCGHFVPIYPDAPFRYISHLKESFLIHKNGKNGILI